jgi:hypothetical protein
MVNHFYKVALIHWWSHEDIWACTPGLAMLGGDGMDFILECVLLGVRGFLLLCPFMPGHLRLTFPEA